MINNTIKNPVNAEYLLELASVPVSSASMLSELLPPKHFDLAQFLNYIPEPSYPSQKLALEGVRQFVDGITIRSSPGLFGGFFIRKQRGTGLYLDGGFGVGKTHLLASAFHSFNGKKSYLSFQELMFLVGLESLAGVVRLLKDYKLLILDEFELDDPANTRISTNLLGQLFERGVSILTSSNTPPGALGEGKFSVEDFERELGELTRHFDVFRIDGEDYRSTHFPSSGKGSTWVSGEIELESLLSSPILQNIETVDSEFDLFLNTLGKVHPMRIRRALGRIDAVVLRNVRQIEDPHAALRFVYFIDKSYDNNILLLVQSTEMIEKIFNNSYFTGGDTKKFRRTISRLTEMTQSGYLRLGG